MEEYIKYVQLVFKRLEKFSVVINLVKCDFGKSEVIFFGYFINSVGISLFLSKEKAITIFPASHTMTKLILFWERINFYRKFLPYCS